MWAFIEWNGSGQNGNPADRLNRFSIERHGDRCLKLRGFLPEGLHKIEISTRPGEFDVRGLMFHCVEYPSMEEVLTGPWDLNHMTNEMVAPVCDILIDGEFWGQGWARRNTPEAMKGGYLEFSLGFETEESGPRVIELVIPETEKRWSWDILSRLVISPDERHRRELTPRDGVRHGRPRCFLSAETLASLKEAVRDERATLWEAYANFIDTGADGTYDYRDLRLALGVLIEGREDWLTELAERLNGRAESENWGFNPLPHAMGYNNDRDAGGALFAAAVAYDWCGEQLPGDLRDRLRERLSAIAEYVYRFTITQRDYLPGGVEAHSLGTWFGLAAAAVALYGEEPRANRWLSWLGGSLRRISSMLPHDGVRDMNRFCAMFTFYLYGLLNEFVQEDLLDETPYFTRFAEGYLRMSAGTKSRPPSGVAELCAYAAKNTRDPIAQWVAWRGFESNGGFGSPSALSPIWFTREPAEPPAEPGLCRTFEGGALVLGGEDSPSLQLRVEAGCSSGSGLFFGNGYHHATCPVTSMGDLTLSLHGQRLLGGPMAYRDRAADHTLVTVDGGGSIWEGCVWGRLVAPEQLTTYEVICDQPGRCELRINSAGAYNSGLCITKAERRLTLLREEKRLAIEDELTSEDLHDFAWNLVSPAEICLVGEQARIRSGEAEVTVRALNSSAEFRTEVVQWVPSYPYGLNTYKAKNWQPEIQSSLNLPNFTRLVIDAPATREVKFSMEFSWD